MFIKLFVCFILPLPPIAFQESDIFIYTLQSILITRFTALEQMCAVETLETSASPISSKQVGICPYAKISVELWY